MIITIISHTPHYQDNEKIYGWGPTVKEVNFLSSMFSQVNHIAPFYDSSPPKSTELYNSSKIKFIPIKPRGGRGIKNKLDIIKGIPFQLLLINNYCKKSDWIQFRAPTNMGMYVLPYLRFFNKTKYWVKYAGDWGIKNPPLSYLLQRFWLKKNYNQSFVTINGKWENQESHLISLENPCLTIQEIIKAKSVIENKNYSGKLILCFVGLISKAKGLGIFLSSLEKIIKNDFIKIVYVVGDGPKSEKFKKRAKLIRNINIRFTGSINRDELNKIYEKSHIIVLPSYSEGFPKVIAEASAYGCVPIVSNVGSVGQYINKSNGVLLKNNSVDNVYKAISFLKDNRLSLKKMSEECNKISKKFSFSRYNGLISKIILKK